MCRGEIRRYVHRGPEVSEKLVRQGLPICLNRWRSAAPDTQRLSPPRTFTRYSRCKQRLATMHMIICHGRHVEARLCPTKARDSWHCGSARGQMQEISTEKFHKIAPAWSRNAPLAIGSKYYIKLANAGREHARALVAAHESAVGTF